MVEFIKRLKFESKKFWKEFSDVNTSNERREYICNYAKDFLDGACFDEVPDGMREDVIEIFRCFHAIIIVAERD